MSDLHPAPDEERPAQAGDEDPESEDVLDDERTVPLDEPEAPADLLPETQDADPLRAAIGDDGQGDLAPEDDPDPESAPSREELAENPPD